MKKFLLTALFMLSLAGVAKAGGELRSTPRGDPQALATADYGGVYRATSTFSIFTTTACAPCSGVFYGVWISTGVFPFNTQPDFVDVWDSTSQVIINAGQAQRFRIYNSFTSGVGSTITVSGFYGPPKPIRFSRGLQFTPSVATYNEIDLLYYQEP